MRIRYAYDLEFADGHKAYVTLNVKKSDEEVQETFAEKGCVKASFHDRVRTGYRVNPETGEIVETGLPHKAPDAPKAVPAKKAKKTKKA